MYNYVYRITNKVLNKHYYGVRSSLCHPTEDLGITYLSSSADKLFITDQKANPDNYKYKIVKICASRVIALKLEVLLHTRFKVASNTSFYNKSNQTSTGFDTLGVKQSKELCAFKSSKFTGIGNPFYGKKHTKESLLKAVDNHPGNEGSKNFMYGKKHTLITKELISRANSGSGNGRALVIHIFNNDNVLMVICNGTFEQTCIDNGFPFKSLKKTYEKGNKMSNPHKTNKAFTGWYARKII